MSEVEFSSECGKLRGMNETRGKAKLGSHAADLPTVVNRVYKVANVIQVKLLKISHYLIFTC